MKEATDETQGGQRQPERHSRQRPVTSASTSASIRGSAIELDTPPADSQQADRIN